MSILTRVLIVDDQQVVRERVVISRVMPLRALSTSAISVFETMSKEGMGLSNVAEVGAPGEEALGCAPAGRLELRPRRAP